MTPAITFAGRGAMKQKFERTQDSLDPIFSFVDDFIASNKLSEAVVFPVKLTIEELFTNLVRHNTGGKEHIMIALEKKKSQLIIQLTDFNVDPFDISKVEKVDTDKPLEERAIGGLGIHLVKSIVDKISYEYSNRTMCVTAVKNLEA
jgi:serine/threonine-protein kinase RsbW